MACHRLSRGILVDMAIYDGKRLNVIGAAMSDELQYWINICWMASVWQDTVSRKDIPVGLLVTWWDVSPSQSVYRGSDPMRGTMTIFSVQKLCSSTHRVNLKWPRDRGFGAQHKKSAPHHTTQSTVEMATAVIINSPLKACLSIAHLRKRPITFL